MDGRQRHGRPDEEMFLNSNQKPTTTTSPETPTVEPLRIAKVHSPPPRAGSAASGASSTNTGPYSLPATTYGAPPTKPPTGPLPYPTGDGPFQASSRLPYPNDPGRSGTPDDGKRRQTSFGTDSSRPKFSGSDPARPSVAGFPGLPVDPQGRAGSPAASGLANKNGKPLPDSPGPETPDKDGLFQRAPQRPGAAGGAAGGAAPEVNPYPEYHQQYWPPPSAGPSSQAAGGGGLVIPNPKGVNRFSSTASTSTTKAQRGSPPPPETPIVPPPSGGIEARYAAAGLGGPGIGLSAAAAQRANQYSNVPTGPAPTPPPSQQQPAAQTPPRRPWTPTEQPGSRTAVPATVYQGVEQIQGPAAASPPRQNIGQAIPTTGLNSGPTAASATAKFPGGPGAAAGSAALAAAAGAGLNPQHHQQTLEHDFNRINLHEEPPPAYSSVPGAPAQQGYPQEKQGLGGAPGASSGFGQPGSAAPTPPVAADDPNRGHPAFANMPQTGTPHPVAQPQATPGHVPTPIQIYPAQSPSPGPATGAGPASPPPMPEGWIAHLDSSSGQYYYIHLATQSTQWEFPKGPTPLNLNEPLSPTGTFINPLSSPLTSTFKQPLASPGFGPAPSEYGGHPGMAALASPTAGGFTGPPPSAGVEIYKVKPTNGVYFGPYLRYTNMDMERGMWLGSILLVTDAPHPPTIHIHQSLDLSPNPRQLKANPIHSHQRFIFYRYDVDLVMDEHNSTKWTYAVTSHLGCTRYEFVIAGRYETSWRFVAHSGNDFTLTVSPTERSRLGGVGFMWKDILQKHIECGGFHAQLGLGDQINADRIWKEIPLLRQWTATSGKENRKNAGWTAKHEEEVTHAYFHYYTSHFDQPHLREAFAQIPHVLALDDHDIFDGFGSYPEYMQFSNMFKNIGRIGIETYLLFQHHTTLEILRNVNNETDLFTVSGTGWHFIKYLGPAVVVIGPDCRSERNPHQVMAGPTYQGLFPKVAVLPPSVQHAIWMVPVPLVYPRLESVETLANTAATGKKAITGTFNMLGKVTGSVAGIVGAKQLVGEGFGAVKKAVGKSGLMSSVLSPFGEIDMLDELRDQWTHESKDLERTYLIRTLQGISHNKSLRMTFFSGAANCCGAGLLHDPSHPSDHKTMYQIITSAVVNAPVGGYVLRLLHNNKPLYIPANGHRSTNMPSDTKEDMMEIFAQDVDQRPRELKRLMGRRNYVACVAYDPEVIQGGQPSGKMSIAVDFLVQSEGLGANVKYGPVIIPGLEYGR